MWNTRLKGPRLKQLRQGADVQLSFCAALLDRQPHRDAAVWGQMDYTMRFHSCLDHVHRKIT